VHHDRAELFRLTAALARNAFDVVAIEASDPLRAAHDAASYEPEIIVLPLDRVEARAALAVSSCRTLFISSTRESAGAVSLLRARGARVIEADTPMAVIMAELCAMLTGAIVSR
jgi:hypothetical protein